MAIINVPRQESGFLEAFLATMTRTQQIAQRQQEIELDKEQLKLQQGAQKLEIEQFQFKQAQEQEAKRKQIEAIQLLNAFGQGQPQGPQTPITGFGGGQAVATPAQGQPGMGTLLDALEQVEAPAADRTAIRRSVAPTTEEKQEMEIARGQFKIQAAGIASATSLLDRGATLDDLAATGNLNDLIGAQTLGIGPSVNQLRQELENSRNHRRVLSRFYTQESVELIAEAGLVGQINPKAVRQALIDPDKLSPAQVEQLAPLGEAIASTKARAAVAEVKALLDMPVQRIFMAQIKERLDEGDNEGARPLIEQATRLFEQQTGMSRDDPLFPYPTLREQKRERELGKGVPAKTGLSGLREWLGFLDRTETVLELDPLDKMVGDMVINPNDLAKYQPGDVKGALAQAKADRSLFTGDELAQVDAIIERLQFLVDNGVTRFGRSGS
jgi:hypothetical protein